MIFQAARISPVLARTLLAERVLDTLNRLLCVMVLLCPSYAYGQDFSFKNILPFGNAKNTEKLQLSIAEAYLDIHTGPGKNYPIFYVAQRGEKIEIQKRRNDWFKVTLKVDSSRIKTGWVHRNAIGQTLVANDPESDGNSETLAKDHRLLHDIYNPKHYMGFNYGRTSSADLVGVYAGRVFTDSISAELQFSEFLGRNSQGIVYGGVMNFAPFTRWKLSPYAQLGGGRIETEARGTNSQQNDDSNQFLQSGLGFHLLMSERYRLRFEYRHINILTSEDENEELETWQIGFSASF